MAAKYYVSLTEYGSSLIAQAHNVVSIQLTEMVIGDANNQPYDPIDQKGRTTLVNERARVPVQSVEIIGQIARVSATIEAQIGGFNMHEYGFIDATGKLVYIANFHGAYKPVIAEGAGGELEIVTDIKAAAGAQILVQIDSNVVTANKQWVLNQLDKKYDKTGGPISGSAQIEGELIVINNNIQMQTEDSNGLITGKTELKHVNQNVEFHTNQSKYVFDKPIYTGEYIVGATGFTTLPNGFLFQFGFVRYEDLSGHLQSTQTDERYFNIEFPVEFPTNCFSISTTLCTKNLSLENDTWTLVTNVTKKGATLFNQTTNPESSTQQPYEGIYWQAIGR